MNGTRSRSNKDRQADVKPTNAELQLELLRVEYQNLVKKNRQDRDRLNNIKRGLEKAYSDLEELRDMSSSN